MPQLDLKMCCRQMSNALGSKESFVNFQTHKLCGHFVWQILNPSKAIICQIDFCPWCGAKLAGSMDLVAEK